MLGGLLRRARHARIDDDDLAAALADPADAAARVGRRKQRAVGDEWVGAEDQEVIGPVEVGHRDAQRAAEHEAAETCFGIWSTVEAE